MDKDLLVHILSGEATAEGKELFYNSLESVDDRDLYLQAKSIWLQSGMLRSKVDVDSEFELLWKKINLYHEKTLNLIGKKILQYAAIGLLILGLGGVSGYLFSKNTSELVDYGKLKYSAMKGSVCVVDFPDGTKVWLNSGSSITYQEDRKNNLRLAELTGEAYFEVKHNAGFTFQVKAKNIVVRDLGTTFNIKAYPEDHFIETSLVEGQADILSEDGENLAVLNPKECAIYSVDEKKIEKVQVVENVMSAWRDGKFIIRDQRLEDIFKELGRWYDVDFQFENQKLRNLKYTGNIKKSTTAAHVMKMLKLTTTINYRIIEKQTGRDKIIVY